MPTRLFIYTLRLCLLILAFETAAASSTSDTIRSQTVFLPADFEQYAPITALDMIERIPGFRLNSGGGQRRGLGQASANVLINGQRISSKSVGVEGFLKRIPAKSVERIELLDGTKLDILGLTGLVANVISSQDGISGTWAYRPTFRPKFDPHVTAGELSVSGQNAHLGWTVGLASFFRGSTGEGQELLFDATGDRIEDSDLSERFRSPEWSASTGLKWAPPSGLVANFNAEYEDSEFEFYEDSKRVATGGAVENRRIDQNGITRSTEISGDLEYGLGVGRIKLFGVYNKRERPFTNSIVKRHTSGNIFEESHFRRHTDETETILRGEYNWAAWGGTLDWSLEGAVNTLESASSLLQGDGSTAPSLADDGESSAEVEEKRSETFLTYSRPLSEKFQLQVSLGTEISELVSAGPNGQKRSFTRPKGGLSLSWSANDDATVSARIDRKVGQLNFFDFVSRVDLDNGEDQVGNSNIVPEQRWQGEIEIEKQFGDWGAGSFRVYGAALEDIVDRIPIGDGEGPGNIDSGHRIGTAIKGTLNFDPLGGTGMQLNYSASVQDSKIDDPLTGESRSKNNESLAMIDLKFRHDIDGTDLAWGGNFFSRDRADEYSLTTIRSRQLHPGRYRFFLEHKNLWGFAGKVEYVRPFNEVEKSKRFIYSPNRNGSLYQVEMNRVEGKPILIFELSGTF